MPALYVDHDGGQFVRHLLGPMRRSDRRRVQRFGRKGALATGTPEVTIDEGEVIALRWAQTIAKAGFEQLVAMVGPPREAKCPIAVVSAEGYRREVRRLGKAGEKGPGGESSAQIGPQLVTREERMARSISESVSTTRAEVSVRAEPGTRAEVTQRPPSGSGITLAASGAP